jgi:hypothetical protein
MKPDQFRFPQQADPVRGKRGRIQQSLEKGPHGGRFLFQAAIRIPPRGQVDEARKVRQAIAPAPVSSARQIQF